MVRIMCKQCRFTLKNYTLVEQIQNALYALYISINSTWGTMCSLFC